MLGQKGTITLGGNKIILDFNSNFNNLIAKKI